MIFKLYDTQLRATDTAQRAPPSSGTRHLSYQGKRRGPRLCARTALASRGISPHGPCPRAAQTGACVPPPGPHQGWLFCQLPQLPAQLPARLLELTVQGWRKGPHQAEDHVTLQKVPAERRETRTDTSGLWGPLKKRLPLHESP